MANRNFLSNKLFQLEAYPVLLSCNFVVDSTNGNGLGIRSLKGAGITNVFMHTTSSPGTNNSQTNPNPESGVIVVNLSDNYSRYLGGFSGQSVILSGSNTATLTAHNPYVITVLGSSTTAQWVAAGLLPGITPAIGVSFIAAANIAGGGMAQAVSASSGIDHIEAIGDPSQMQTLGQFTAQGNPTSGTQLILAAYSAGALTAPTNGSVVGLSFYLSNSSVQVQGQ